MILNNMYISIYEIEYLFTIRIEEFTSVCSVFNKNPLLTYNFLFNNIAWSDEKLSEDYDLYTDIFI